MRAENEVGRGRFPLISLIGAFLKGNVCTARVSLATVSWMIWGFVWEYRATNMKSTGFLEGKRRSLHFFFLQFIVDTSPGMLLLRSDTQERRTH